MGANTVTAKSAKICFAPFLEAKLNSKRAKA
jgi:hypothetical protein